MGFKFNNTARKALERYLSSGDYRWDWREFEAVLGGGGYVKATVSGPAAIGRTKGSQQVYRFSAEKVGAKEEMLAFITKVGFLTLTPHMPHGKRSTMASIDVERLVDALVLINFALPEEEKLDELRDEELLSSTTMERIRR